MFRNSVSPTTSSNCTELQAYKQHFVMPLSDPINSSHSCDNIVNDDSINVNDDVIVMAHLFDNRVRSYYKDNPLLYKHVYREKDQVKN